MTLLAARLSLPCVLGLLSLTWAGQASAQATAPRPSPAAEPAWMGIKAGLGVRISELVPGGPAELAGLRPLDIITAVGDMPLSERSLAQHIASRRPGDTLLLSVLRGDEELTVALQLAAWPDEVPRADAQDAPEDLVLKLEGKVERAYLGLRAKEMSAGLATYLGLETKKGVMVEHVEAGEAAALAGLKAGDVLLELAGHPVEDILAMDKVMRELKPGQNVALKVFTRGEERTVQAKLGSREKQIISMAGGQGGAATPAGRELLREALARQYEALEREFEAKQVQEEQLRKLLERLPTDQKRLKKRLSELSKQLERMEKYD